MRLGQRAETVQIFGVRVPVARPDPSLGALVRSKRFSGPQPGETGRTRAIVYEFVRYPSWTAAVRATGLTKSALRWRIFGKKAA